MLSLRSQYVRAPRGGSAIWTSQDAASGIVNTEFFGVSAPPAIARVWNGAAWIIGTVRVWTGTLWAAGNVRRWTGSTWS